MKQLRFPARQAVAVAAVAVGTTAALLGPVATSSDPLVSAAAPAERTLPTEPLDILLTNDDGWAAPGIRALYDALVADGHQVTLVAPSTNQSGVSARVDFAGTLTASRPVPGDPRIWSVSTSPVGSLLFALDVVLPEHPDLVISGTNVGANTGFDTNFSGTIGAATVGSGMFAIPSIAVSAATGSGAPGAYEEVAALVVDLLDRGLPILPRGQFLNINYPRLGATLDRPLGIRYAATDPASAASFGYEQDPSDPTSYRIVGARGTEQPGAGTDMALLAEGYVTVGVLDADRSVEQHEAPAVAKLIRELARAGAS